MRKIKWENILSLLLVIIAIASMIKHITINGYYFGLLFEMIIDYSLIVFNYFLVKNLRKN